MHIHSSQFSLIFSKKIRTVIPGAVISRKFYAVSNEGEISHELEKYHATCFPGLEKHLKQELEKIKAHSIVETTAGSKSEEIDLFDYLFFLSVLFIKLGVSFQTTLEQAYEINLKSRVALRVLHHITEGPLDLSIR